MSRLKALSITALVLALVAQPLAAAGDKAYKWVDADGNVNYGAAPPRDQPAEELILRKGPVPAAADESPGAENTPALPAMDPDENAADENPKPELSSEQQQARRQVNEANCTIARQNLKTLEAMPDRIIERDADGNEVELKDDELAARRERAQANVEKFCN
ncbi:MAG: DUF4124 domain-containing protein [Gammaproteobacteria bacterium]|nr:DUF4124 domain-containing protein [Gammaproteobacteria bacterium]